MYKKGLAIGKTYLSELCELYDTIKKELWELWESIKKELLQLLQSIKKGVSNRKNIFEINLTLIIKLVYL